MRQHTNGHRETLQGCEPKFIHLADGTAIPLDNAESHRTGRAHPEAHASGSEEAREVASARFGDGTLLETIEDPENSNRATFAAWKGGTISFVKTFVSEGQLFIPLRRDRGIGKSIQLPNGVERFESPAKLATEAGALVGEIVEIPKKWSSCWELLSYTHGLRRRILFAPVLWSKGFRISRRHSFRRCVWCVGTRLWSACDARGTP